MKTEEKFNELRNLIQKEKSIIGEITSSMNYYQNSGAEEKIMISAHLKVLKEELRKTNERIPGEIRKLTSESSGPNFNIDLPSEENKIMPAFPANKSQEIKKPISIKNSAPQKNFIERIGLDTLYKKSDLKPTPLEMETIKRMKKKREEDTIKKKESANDYVKASNKFFSDFSKKLISKKVFPTLEEDLIKSNLKFTENSYIAMVIFTTIILFGVSFLIMIFFLFFIITPELPIVLLSKAPFITRLIRVFWMPIVLPIATFLMMIAYPSLERASSEKNINQELPFAVINMSAIAGSMINPSKIFKIIITTNEYPYLEREFKKLINEINIYGYDFVSALRDSALKSPSKKLTELFNGLATTINSGGNLPEFFDKRAQTLLFEYKIEKEKNTKAAETFMDIYISIVIAAPMILMILLMMMKMSGLGVALSTGSITLVIVTAVAVINIIFLTFLH